MEELLHKLTILEEENNKLKLELEETKEHLKNIQHQKEVKNIMKHIRKNYYKKIK